MSIVPLVRGNTVVKTKADFDAAGGRQGETILIMPLDDSQLLLNGDDESNVTYDLRVGEEYRDHRYKGKADIGEDGIKLRPNSAVIIQTLEHLHLPKSRFGYIVPKVSLLQKGISNTSSKVDPGYDGRLLVTVFNLGSKTETLRKRQKFCTIAFHEIAERYRENTRLYGKGEKRLEGATYTDVFRKLFYAFRRIAIPLVVAVVILALFKFPKFADAVEHRTGAIGLVLLVVSVFIVCIEAGLLHKIVELLHKERPK